MSSKKIKTMTYIVLIIVVVIVGGLTYRSYADLSDQKEAKAAAFKKTSVATAIAKSKPFTAWAFAEGTVHALHREYIQSDAAGIIAELGSINGQTIREGMSVSGPMGDQPGDLLVRIESRSLEAQAQGLKAELRGATAGLEQAKRNFDRAKIMVKKNIIPKADYERVATEYKSAQARVKAAEAQLKGSNVAMEKKYLAAPSSGVIKRINVRVGDYYAGAEQAAADSDREANSLLVIIDTRQLEAVLNIPLWDSEQVKIGQRVYLANSSQELSKAFRSGFKEGSFAVGEVYSESPSISLDKRSIEVKVRTTEGAQFLRDGSHVIAWIVTDEKDKLLTVPHRAVISREAGDFAFVYNPETKTVQQRRLKAGVFGLDEVEIIDGIKEGEVVVIDGLSNLTDGAPVTVVRADDDVQ